VRHLYYDLISVTNKYDKKCDEALVCLAIAHQPPYSDLTILLYFFLQKYEAKLIGSLKPGTS
jgi:hypothetical protein